MSITLKLSRSHGERRRAAAQSCVEGGERSVDRVVFERILDGEERVGGQFFRRADMKLETLRASFVPLHDVGRVLIGILLAKQRTSAIHVRAPYSYVMSGLLSTSASVGQPESRSLMHSIFSSISHVIAGSDFKKRNHHCDMFTRALHDGVIIRKR